MYIRKLLAPLLAFVLLAVSGCSALKDNESQNTEPLRVGILLSNVGLGDESFSDAGIKGLIRARDELGIRFDYREPGNDKTSQEQALEELAAQGSELIIGLGFSAKEDLEKAAKKHPELPYLLVDEVSDLPNVSSITFKEDEGSFLVGAIAGMKSKTGVIGFIGGVDVPIIHKFQRGFEHGVRSVSPNAKVLSAYAGTFGDDQKGAELAGEMFKARADIIFPAAGFTGVGALKAAEQAGRYGIGVDTDQFFVAEKAVLTSMLKNVDVAVYQAVKEFSMNRAFAAKQVQLGLKEQGVDYAPVRLLGLSEEEAARLEMLKKQLKEGSLTIPQ
ncbi:BMP family lipoprotein [Paenibacillus sp. S-38]|uniref:BMP family lipoprotein n=1 Tax=Paenibacillus sp. S-38 TaxID=3416710 RepID=UPI003CFA1201